MPPNLTFAPYSAQSAIWPKFGRHILAQYNAETILVYQAYRPEIASYAMTHGHFGGEFSFERMSWIKPNFLWMMYRSAWGTRPGQEVTLAVRLHRSFFDSLLAQAVESSFTSDQSLTYEEWQRAVRRSSVRLQWDPDHHPAGPSLPRRAIQLGLRGKSLRDYGKKEIIEIFDLSEFVAEQRENVASDKRISLLTPLEQVYLPADPAIRLHLRLDSPGS